MNKPKLTMIEFFSGIGAQKRGIDNTGLYDLDVVATSDVDKEAVVEYAAIHHGLTNEMVEKYDKYPSREEMVEELKYRNIGMDFDKGKMFDWDKLIKKKTKELEKYWLAMTLQNNLGDISKIEQAPIADCWFYSSPCFVPGTMVLTDSGYKAIEDIDTNDKVLTHTNTYQRVVIPMVKPTNKLVEINCMQSNPIKCTLNHPFYVRKRNWKYDTNVRYTSSKSIGKEKKIRYFTDPEWVEAKDLSKDYYVGVAINKEEKLPVWNGIDLTWNDRNRTEHRNILSNCFSKNEFWWIIGRFIGDGWVRTDKNSYGITICCDKSETNEIINKLDLLQWNYCVVEERTVNKIQISFKEIAAYCEQFGNSAANKHLTGDIINLPIYLLKSFLDGYFSADGCYTKEKLYQATSVSKELIYGIGQCIAKAYKRPFRVYKNKRKPTHVIEDRIVNQKDTYIVSFKMSEHKQDKAFYENGYIWCPIKSITELDYDGLVYNMEVENDNSYTVQNVIVHNCQCFSVAGKQDGLAATCNACGQKYNPMDYDVEHRYICPHCGSDDIKGTRSGLLLEVERLLIKAIETNTAPKYLCLENVKNLVGKQFKPDFDAWIKRLEHLGYNTRWEILNAKTCGIPQNRERVFAFSIRKDIDTGKFTFPLPFDTGIRLKDILEKNVEEKYYINTERASNLIQQLVDKGQLKGQRECCDMSDNNPNVKDTANTIVQRYDKGISARRAEGTAVAEPQPILVKNQGTEYVKDLDESVTLKARDWKGWDNYGSTAIVESEKIDDQKRLGGLWDGETKHQAGSVWDSNGMSPTLDTAQGGGRMPHIVENTVNTIQNNNKQKTKSIWKDINSHYKISSKGVVVDVINKCQVEEIDGKVELEVKGKMAKFPIDALLKKYFEEDNTPEVIGIKQATKKGYIECELPGCADLSYPSSTTRRGRVQDGGQTSPTITATETGVHYIESIYRIRKLTVRECFALMGFEFSDWDACSAMSISNSAGYKAAGNSIVTNCISLLFEHLYKAQYDETYICTDEKMQNFTQPKEK